MTKKPLADLNLTDLLNMQVWEHWTENNIEYVRPVSIAEISENSNVGHIVLTEFIFSNKKKYLGFCSSQDPSGLDYIQPVIFTDKGQLEFYKNDDWTMEEIKKALGKLELGSQDVFPVNYKTKIKCDGKFYSGILLGFSSLNKTNAIL